MTQDSQSQSGQTVIINQSEKESNGIGTAGFVLAIIALFFGWVPVLGYFAIRSSCFIAYINLFVCD